ncbi:MAG: hypothetical protein D6719_02400 [Candidatus Dadabacteria bacterium]|nr:MAG: hypothetical protein D6719_02400 [Candidatus Dadabacteria bacterium]
MKVNIMKLQCKHVLARLLGICLLVVAGCSVRRSFVRPEIQIADLQLSDLNLFETTLVFTVRVNNENPYPLRLTGSRYKFYLNDVYTGKGMVSEPLVIPALGSATQRVKVHLNNLSVLPKIVELSRKASLDYKIASVLYVKNRLSQSTYKVSSTGSFIPAGIS